MLDNQQCKEMSEITLGCLKQEWEWLLSSVLRPGEGTGALQRQLPCESAQY